MGWRVIDTAEMYGEGGAEEVVGEASPPRCAPASLARDDLFVVSKVYPHNASAHGTVAACERSLGRLGLDHLDSTCCTGAAAFRCRDGGRVRGLRDRGRIRHWGVSNFDVDDMDELWRLPGGDRCATNQIYYSLTARGPGFELVPWLQASAIATMAYSPIDQGALARNAALGTIAKRRGVSRRSSRWRGWWRSPA